MTRPSCEHERALLAAGATHVIGFDEVGKGAWAGPLMVGAAVLRRSDIESLPTDGVLAAVRDSKALSEKKREALFEPLAAACQTWAFGIASPAECDSLGMNDAQRLAARRACASLGIAAPEAAAIVDGTWDFVSPHVGDVITEVKADASCMSVAVASVLAKVSRDRLMRALAADYPLWSFETNKGYPCAKHRAALQGYGPSALHRTTWAFMDNFVPWMERSR